MEKQGTIYKIENLINKRVYIGQTVQRFVSRKNAHIRDLKKNNHHNLHLQNAWNKYGKKSFSFSILEVCDINKLDELEIKWISYYKNNSYNIQSGGQLHRFHGKETIDKMRKINKEKAPRGKNHYFSKRVVLTNTGEIFETMNEASKKTGANYSSISKCCHGNGLYAGKMPNGDYMFWTFESDYDKTKDYSEKINIQHYNKGKGNGNASKVKCLTTNEIFDTLVEASKKYKTSSANISAACRKKTNYAGELLSGIKLKWEYI